MHLSLFEAHLACAALVGADLAARSLRICWILRGLGWRIPLREAFTFNAFGDAGCALTPLRLGGEPARLAGMLRAGVPATAAVVAIGMEVLAAWPVIIIAAGWLAWRYAPAWWEHLAPAVGTAAVSGWPWALGILLVSVACWIAARRIVFPGVRTMRHSVRRVLVYWRRLPWWVVAGTVPLTLVNLVARVAILPVLALTLAEPPSPGPTWLGSFALLYSQLLLPTPSGAGAVDFGFLAGTAGDLGGAEYALLLSWRFYTSIAGATLGVWLAARVFGWAVLRRVVRRDRRAGMAV